MLAFRLQRAAGEIAIEETVVGGGGFLLVFFAKAGTPPFEGYCDPLAVADVKMEAKRDGSGEWKISLFDSGQVFKR